MEPYTTRTRGSLTEPTVSTPISATSWWEHPDTGVTYTTVSSSIADYKRVDDIYEVYGIGRWHYKDCSFHTKSVHPVVVKYGPLTNPGCHSQNLNDTKYGGSTIIAATEPVLTGANGSDWARLGGRFEQCLPTMRPDTDLFVFLAELRDLNTMVDFFRKRADTLVEQAAATDLTYHFALAPFIGEAIGILKTAAQAKTHLRALRKGVGKIHSSQFGYQAESEISRDVVPWSSWKPIGCTGTCPNGLPASTKVVTTERTIKLSGSVKYRYEMPGALSAWEGHLFDTLNGWGLIPKTESIWELVPFSFVVDWVFNTSRFFKTLHLDTLIGDDVKTEIIDICVSEREDVKTTTSYNRMCMSYNGFSQSGAVCHINKYQRVSGRQALGLLSGPWLKWPSFMAVHLGASLAYMLSKR